MQRIRNLSTQLSTQQPGTTLTRSTDDIVIVSAVRTAICRAKKGGFAETAPEELLSVVLREVVGKVGVRCELVDDICVGNVLPPGGGATLARMAALHAGFPEQTAVSTTNRQCSSGLQAVAQIAAAISKGWIDVGIGAGVESMSMYYEPANLMPNAADSITACDKAKLCLLPMGVTSENVAEKFKISRERQDKFALTSHQRAHVAQQQGLFKDEIVPVKTASGRIVDMDDGIRGTATLEALSKLKPAFSESGTTTPGNASQVSDGAAAVLLMKRSKAKELGLPIMGRMIGFAVAGVPPEIMGIGPALAIPKVLQQCHLTKDEISVFEINEAFASQAVYCVEHLGLDPAKVNPLGGAIALGHPLGCTGARQVSTLLYNLKRRRERYGVISMCIGTGMGAAAVFENESV